jgi:glutamine amidotransferase
MRVVILDYGVGNLFSLKSALEREGATPVISPELPMNDEFAALVLPGVGAFSPVAEKLNTMSWRIRKLVDGGLPVLGVCLGMQMFFNESEEGPGTGLDLMEGHVVRLPSSVKVPHIGWNNLRIRRPDRLLLGIEDGDWAYFVHSFHPVPVDSEVIVADCGYGTTFPAVVASGNVYGTQFHPEKSGLVGRRLLRNFLEIVGERWKS